MPCRLRRLLVPHEELEPEKSDDFAFGDASGVEALHHGPASPTSPQPPAPAASPRTPHSPRPLPQRKHRLHSHFFPTSPLLPIGRAARTSHAAPARATCVQTPLTQSALPAQVA